MLYCYKCGCELGTADRCPNCGADVTTYRKIIYTSNYLYNQGLEKAGVRDLTGAILALKESLWFNKNNLDARNLLGLIYYELGETVAALSEWVISKNLNDEKLHEKENAAGRYLDEVQNNKQVMENITASIDRYNHALECCYSDNLDVAILQLKKVLSLNPHYLRARQLLALLYIETRDWKKAERELQKCLRLDINNTTTLRYLKEVEEQLSPQTGEDSRRQKSRGNAAGTAAGKGRSRGRGVSKDGVIKYTADNETIIQPVGSRVPGIDGFGMPGNIIAAVIGCIIGAALVAFLVMPSRVSSVRQQASDEVRTMSEEMSSKDTQIDSLQEQVDALTQENETLTAQAEEETQPAEQEEENSAADADSLMQTAADYILTPDDTDAATDVFAALDPATAKENESDAFAGLYDALYAVLQSPMLEKYAWAGIGAYEADEPDYAAAITDLVIANRYEDETAYSMTYVERLYYLGDAYYQVYMAASDEEKQTEYADYPANARTYLEMVTQGYPDSEYAAPAQERLLDIATNITPTAEESTASAETQNETETAEAGGETQETAEQTEVSE